MQFVVKSVAVLSGIALIAGFGGALHPIGDSWAVFRVEITVIFALAVIWTDWPRRLRWPLSGVSLALLLWHLLQSYAGAPQQRAFALYQQNLLYHREDGGAQFVAALSDIDPDFITLQEVSVLNRPILDNLRPQFPSQHHCPLGKHLGEAVLSRHPKIDGTGFCSARDGMAGMQLQTPGGPVWVVSVHLNWPWPRRQASQITQILPDLARLSGPIVMGGDFNAVAWSHSLSRIEQASGAQRQGPYGATFHLPFGGLPIGIDHVLTSPDFKASLHRQPKLGADHHGLLAHIDWINHD